MKVVLREDKSGVSEVVGTILILAMTVVLFSTIILWVSNIPTPTAQNRLDLQATLNPFYNPSTGQEIGVNITLQHTGGEALQPFSTVIYIQDQKGSGTPTTDALHLSLWHNAISPNGLLDGTDSVWNIGERWAYQNNTMRSTDKITVTIVDTAQGVVLFNSQLTPPPGTRPPVFLNVWADRIPATPTIDPLQSGQPIYIMAQVTDPDGDLNPNSVFATLTMFYGTGDSCAQPQQMNDQGSNGDLVAHDGTYTLWRSCINSASISWDGALVLLNATDMKGHQTTTRFTLHITLGPGGSTGGGNAGSGRPPNLRWNGNQGYNIFNATQWDQLGFAAQETRTFKPSETVVVVVGSLSLENTFGVDSFNLWDPYSGSPQQAVVYGSNKAVGTGSVPSNTQAFSFYEFVNGYYIYTYRFTLNTPTQTNFYVTPPSHPPYYYFASYPLSVLLTSSTGDRFTMTDSVNITSSTGYMRLFPKIETFSDSGFTHPATHFASTQTMYVQVDMLTVDSNSSMANVAFGNIMIQDFAGGYQLNRAPTNGIYSNLPICPASGSCSSTNKAFWSIPSVNSYRFAINLARVNQDPWVAGNQSYSLVLSSVKDSDESYTSVSTQISVQAPLYMMDLAMGADEGSNPAWSGHNYALFYQDYNGFDAWKSLPVDTCGAGGQSTSGLSGGGNGKCPTASNIKLAFGDFWHDGTLGLAESIVAGSNHVVLYRHTVDATGAVVYLPVFYDNSPPTTCTAIAAGDVTGNGLPSIICGGSNGWVWYYANNGNWTRTYVDQPSSGQQINSVTIGDFNGDGWNDIAVAGASGYMKYYPNLGYGRFQNTGISDNWFAAGEQTVQGSITGSYLNTFVQDGSYEQLTEGTLNIPIQTGATTNPGMNNSAQNWTYANAYNGGSVSGSTPSSGGNPGSYVQISTTRVSNSVVAGYWYQPFTVSGAAPYTATLNLSYRITSFNAPGGAVTFYAFVDTASGAPPQSPTSASYVWTSGPLTSTGSWTSVSGINVASKVTGTGTYYLKVAMYTTYQSSGFGSTQGGFDNVALRWSSTPGSTSALEQYWRIGPLPTRLGTAFTFNLIGHETGGTTPPEYDNFTIAYSTDVGGTDPTTGTYTTMFTVQGTSDRSYSFALPVSVAGKTVWVRAIDTNRVVTGSPSYDSLFVDQMYINANTPSGTTGVTLTNPGDSSTINMIDAQDQNGDHYWDLVVGTSNGHVFEYMGSPGGLQIPSSYLYYAGSGNSIVGVAFGNFSTNYPGLEIALAFGTTVRVIRGDTGGVIMNALPPFSPSSTITAFAVGDINGDGWDDIAIGTAGSSGAIFLWENLGQGTSWTYAVTLDTVGSTVFSIVLGDTTNSQYLGR